MSNLHKLTVDAINAQAFIFSLEDAQIVFEHIPTSFTVYAIDFYSFSQ